MNDIERYRATWQIYEIMVPGMHDHRTVVAASVTRALQIAMEPDDCVQAGELLVVQNVTASWIIQSPMASQSTWSILQERREGFLDFDHRDGWTRRDC